MIYIKKDNLKTLLLRTGKAPYEIEKLTTKSLAYTLKETYQLLRNALKIPGAINYLRNRTEEYQNNIILRNEDFMEDIEKGRFILGQARSSLLGYDINYSRKQDGRSALMLSFDQDNKLLQKFILDNQRDFSKQRLNLNQTDFAGDYALIHAVKSGNDDNCAFIVSYPEILIENISKYYFSGSNKIMYSPQVEKLI